MFNTLQVGRIFFIKFGDIGSRVGNKRILVALMRILDPEFFLTESERILDWGGSSQRQARLKYWASQPAEG